jgi:integrase
MQTAMRARVLREKPAAGHSIPHRRKRVRVLTMAEIDQLATHADERYRAAIWLLALTGVRTSERLGAARDQGSVTVNEVQMWVGGQLVVKGRRPRAAFALFRSRHGSSTPSGRQSTTAPSEPESRCLRPIDCSRRQRASRCSTTPSGA